MPSLPIECGPAARAAFVQAVAGLAVISYLNPGSNQRVAIGAACMLSIMAMPFARCAAHLSSDHPSVYWWAGRAWTVAIPALCAKTIPGAFDGSGPAMAERVKQRRLKAIVIEVSYTSYRPDSLLFGHLTPRWLMEELRKLDGLAGGKALKDLPVVVSHVKYSLTKEQPQRQLLQELEAANDVGVRFVVPEQGSRWHFK